MKISLRISTNKFLTKHRRVDDDDNVERSAIFCHLTDDLIRTQVQFRTWKARKTREDCAWLFPQNSFPRPRIAIIKSVRKHFSSIFNRVIRIFLSFQKNCAQRFSSTQSLKRQERAGSSRWYKLVKLIWVMKLLKLSSFVDINKVSKSNKNESIWKLFQMLVCRFSLFFLELETVWWIFSRSLTTLTATTKTRWLFVCKAVRINSSSCLVEIPSQQCADVM